ncbi:MAG: hypothetical protein OEM52_11540 [bacterium]|nr:hypothetical protein [bacterium]
MNTKHETDEPLKPATTGQSNEVRLCDCEHNEAIAKKNLARKTSPGFEPDSDFWDGFHSKVICNCNRTENFSERLSRWRTVYLPCTFIQYSNGGLVRMVLLGVIAIISILLLLKTPAYTHTPQTPESIRIERDSTGLPVYHSVEVK